MIIWKHTHSLIDMGDRNSAYVLGAFLILLISLVSVATGLVIMNFMQGDEEPLSYTVEGEYLEGSAHYQVTGTGTCGELHESDLSHIYEYTFDVSYQDSSGKIHNEKLISTLIVSSDTKLPVEPLYKYEGTDIVNDTEVSVWIGLDTSNGESRFYYSDGKALRIDFSTEKFDLTALVDQM